MIVLEKGREYDPFTRAWHRALVLAQEANLEVGLTTLMEITPFYEPPNESPARLPEAVRRTMDHFAIVGSEEETVVDGLPTHRGPTKTYVMREWADQHGVEYTDLSLDQKEGW